MITMKHQGARPHRRASRVSFIGLLLGFLASTPATNAQPVIGSPPAAQLVPASMRQIADTGPKPSSSTNTAPPLRSGGSDRTSPFSWGPFSLHPYFSERFLYSDGLQARPGRPSNSYINPLSPGFRVDFGKNWTASYGANWAVYTNRAFKESLDHAVNVAGTLAHKSWTAHFSQGYATSTAPMIETGRQTGQEGVSTSFGVTKIFDRRFSVSSTVGQNLQFITSAPDNYTWTTDHSLHYRRSARLGGAIGVGAGYVDMDPGVNMAYVRPNAQISWTPSEKLTFSAQGGENIQQIYSRGVSAKYTPVFNVSGQYKPFQYTSVSLTAGRTVSPSVLRNQVNDSTTWSTGFTQRFLKHFNVSGNYGETDSGYSATNERVTGGRRDKSYNYGLRLGTTFLKRGSIGLLYQGTHNGSNATGFGFDSTQTGVEVGYRY